MLGLLIRKQIHDIFLSRKFAITFGVMSILILIAFYSGSENFRSARANYQAALAQNRTQNEGLQSWSMFRPMAFMEPNPLGAVISGVSNDVGRQIGVSRFDFPNAESSRFDEEPVLAVFRLIDIEFVFTFGLSLFAIMFAFDAINGEKQDGTLALALSNPIPRDTYILGKYIGTYVGLGAPLLIPVLIGVLILPITGTPLNADDIARLAVILLAAALYLGVFLSLSIMMSCATKRPAMAFLGLLIVWICLVQVIPRLSGGVAARAVNVIEKEDISRQATAMTFARFREAGKQIDAKIKRGEIDQDGYRSLFDDLMDQMQERDARIIESLQESRNNQVEARTRLALNLGRISPVVSFRLAATTMAGTSLEMDRRFHDEARAYQSVYVQFLSQKGADGFSMSPIDMESKTIDVSEAPQFVHTSPGFGNSIASGIFDLGLLLLQNIVLFGFSFLLFRRFDVR